jgi:PTS system ascorbate-specific IIA component
MTTRILIIAHAPLATALRECALHVFPDCTREVVAIDVPPNEAPEDTFASAQHLLEAEPGQQILVLTDVIGATPSNVAQRLVQAHESSLIAGVNLPMLLRTVCYRHENLEALTSRALEGGTQGVLHLGGTSSTNK